MYFKTTYDQQFDDLYMHLKAKYPDKLFDLDGIGKQLDMSDFSKNFFSSDVNADASIDANANVDDISVIAYNSELPKPFFRLNSYYVLWNELRKEHGLEVANDIVEKNLTGDIYINDFHGVGGGLPYSYYGKTVLAVKVGKELIYTTFEDLYNTLAKGHEEKVILDSTQIYLKDVKILDKDNKWVNVSRILKHKSHTDLVKIETKNGMCTIVTKDHPVILNEDMNEKLAGTLTLSDTVLCSNSDLIFTEEKMVSIPTAYKCGKQQKSIVPCDILTWDKRSIKAFLGGVIDRRGHVNKNGEVIITSYSFDFIQKVAEIVRWLGYGLVKTSFQGRATFNSKNEVYQCNIILLDSSFGLFSELIQSYKDLVCNVSSDICYDYTSEISKIELMDTVEYVYDITTDSGHFHCQGLIQHNCFNYSALDIHQQGLPMVKKVRSLPPKHLYAYKSQLEQFVTIASNSTLGATGLSDMLVVMSHYVDKILKTRQDDHFKFATEEDCWKYVKGNLASFIYTINQPMRGNQCVTEDTEVLTPEGFKKYNELKAGDLTYTWKDGKLNIQEVEKVNIYDYDGEMHEYSGRDTIQVVTPNHRVLYKNNITDKYELTESSNLINSDIPITYPSATSSSDLESINYAGKRFREEVLTMLIENEIVHKCSNENAANDVQHLCFLAGKNCRKEGLTLYISNETTLTADTKKVIQYKGKVWCPTTQDGIVVFRKDGKIFISGNSPFTNIGIFDREFLEKMCEEYIFNDGSSPNINTIMKLQEMFLEVMNEELERTPLTFPVTTACFSVDEEKNIKDEKFLQFISKRNKKFGFINIYCGDSSTLSSCCFSGDQKVKVVNTTGTRTFQKPIEKSFEEIYKALENPNDDVLYVQSSEEKDIYKKCKMVRLQGRQLYKIFIKDNPNIILKVTDNHINPTKRGDIETTNLVIGDVLLSKLPFDCIIEAIEKIDEIPEYVYCFEMLDKENPYFCLANGVITHNCRLRSDRTNEYFNSFGSGSSKIGSLGVVTINLPRLAIKFPKEDIFLQELEKLVTVAGQINNAKREIVRKRIENGNHPLYTFEFMDLSKQYSTCGVCGFNETIEILGENILEEKGVELGIKILDKINDTNDQLQALYKNPHNCEQIPAEGTAVKLADKDRLLGYQDSYVLYSNQFIPLTTNASLLDRIRLQGIFDAHFSGGAICHLNVEQQVENWEDIADLIRMSAKKGVIYFAINYTLAECEHGHMSVTKGDKCNICGGNIINHYMRVVGFITNVKNWIKTRREVDYPNRQFYDNIKEK